ncbi:MAG: hypothetical protein Q9184_001538 [Pyrenodesmia sp. 2 TL-2023]
MGTSPKTSRFRILRVHTKDQNHAICNMSQLQRHKTGLLESRNTFTSQLVQAPYSYITYLKRAECHENLGFADLGAGDVYRALLLIDEVLDESGEYHEQAVEAVRRDLESGGTPKDDGWRVTLDLDPPAHVSDGAEADIPEYLSSIAPTLEKDRLLCFEILSRLLIQCGCLRSAYGFAERGFDIAPGDPRFLNIRRQILETNNAVLLEKEPNRTDWNYNPKTELPEQGYARRELYPWNKHEPDRLSKESVRFLNGQMKNMAPRCEVRVVDLPVLEADPSSSSSEQSATTKQLGIFATEDISPYEIVLQETSILTANNRLHDPLCDACSAPLPPISSLQTPLPTCPECDDIIFCSQRCHDLAISLYHPAVCGKPDLEAVAKDPSPLAATNALYLLLLGRTFALSETQSVHPLDLDETKHLCGDFISSPPLTSSSSAVSRKLPFTFDDNIVAPLHLLEKMDIDPFISLPATDTWVTQTLLAKFRGTASARMNPRTGIPEACAVHPMWCLANHSCAPNVRWEWVGDMKLMARGGDDAVKWGVTRIGEVEGGIRRGEEVLSYYCDIELGVRERREWAAGALGGICVCERCLWEDAERRKEATEEQKREDKAEESVDVRQLWDRPLRI